MNFMNLIYSNLKYKVTISKKTFSIFYADNYILKLIISTKVSLTSVKKIKIVTFFFTLNSAMRGKIMNKRSHFHSSYFNASFYGVDGKYERENNKVSFVFFCIIFNKFQILLKDAIKCIFFSNKKKINIVACR